MSLTQNLYVGNRYVPKICGEWNNQKEYESLSIVQYQGNSYTSVQNVPKNIDILNESFWVCTGNYNVQVEQYRQECIKSVKEVTRKFNDFVANQEDYYNIILNKTKENINKYTEDKYNEVLQNVSTTENKFKDLQSSIDQEYENTKTEVKEYVDKQFQQIDNERQQIENMLKGYDFVVDGGTFLDTTEVQDIDGGAW